MIKKLQNLWQERKRKKFVRSVYRQLKDDMTFPERVFQEENLVKLAKSHPSLLVKQLAVALLKEKLRD